MRGPFAQEGASYCDEPLALDKGGRNISDLAARPVWLLGSGQPPVALIYCDEEASDVWARLLPSQDGVIRDGAGNFALQHVT
jgi:hypothetical protein